MKKNKGFGIGVVLQSLIISGLWMYSKIDNWYLIGKRNILFQPFDMLIAYYLLIMSIIISFTYLIMSVTIKQEVLMVLTKERKVLTGLAIKPKVFRYFMLSILINLGIIAIGTNFFSETQLRDYHFNKYEDERNEIVEMIMNGELQPDERHEIDVPSELSYNRINSKGYIMLVRHTEMGIFFCMNSGGLLGSATGYIYRFEDFDSDILSKEMFLSLVGDVSYSKDYGNGWYFVQLSFW
jgi:hypothetical protein